MSFRLDSPFVLTLNQIHMDLKSPITRDTSGFQANLKRPSDRLLSINQKEKARLLLISQKKELELMLKNLDDIKRNLSESLEKKTDQNSKLFSQLNDVREKLNTEARLIVSSKEFAVLDFGTFNFDNSHFLAQLLEVESFVAQLSKIKFNLDALQKVQLIKVLIPEKKKLNIASLLVDENKQLKSNIAVMIKYNNTIK
eukprot:NODE_29_length_33183_cov_0.333666.p16 type:complete len:198 gc:universal NODE_29_length_33183_cov_0.333666:8437-7844(-)